MSGLSIASNVAMNRNDLILKELYEERKWKQALTQCEKRQKKGEKGEFFLVITPFHLNGCSLAMADISIALGFSKSTFTNG